MRLLYLASVMKSLENSTSTVSFQAKRKKEPYALCKSILRLKTIERSRLPMASTPTSVLNKEWTLLRYAVEISHRSPLSSPNSLSSDEKQPFVVFIENR